MAALGHVAVGLVAGRLHRACGEPDGGLARPMLAYAALALAPDLDAIGLRLGVPYAHPLGHRGFTHSVCFALVAALVAALAARASRLPPLRVGLLSLLALGSHGPLDMLTDGGLGVALLWPLTATRWFAPWTPLPVAPLGMRGWLSASGVRVLLVEAAAFAPLWLYACWPRPRPRGA